MGYMNLALHGSNSHIQCDAITQLMISLHHTMTGHMQE